MGVKERGRSLECRVSHLSLRLSKQQAFFLGNSLTVPFLLSVPVMIAVDTGFYFHGEQRSSTCFIVRGLPQSGVPNIRRKCFLNIVLVSNILRPRMECYVRRHYKLPLAYFSNKFYGVIFRL